MRVRNVGQRQELVDLIGEEATEKLYNYFLGQTVYFDNCLGQQKRLQELYAQIEEMLSRGNSAKEIAKALNYSVYTIHKRIREIRNGVDKGDSDNQRK